MNRLKAFWPLLLCCLFFSATAKSGASGLGFVWFGWSDAAAKTALFSPFPPLQSQAAFHSPTTTETISIETEMNGLRYDRFTQRKILGGFMAFLLSLAVWHLFFRKRNPS